MAVSDASKYKSYVIHCPYSDDLQDLRKHFFTNYKYTPVKYSIYGEKLVKITHPNSRLLERLYYSLNATDYEVMSDRIVETAAFFLSHIVPKGDISRYSPSDKLAGRIRHDLPVLWMKEVAYSPWEDREHCLDWVIARALRYTRKKPSIQELVWAVDEDNFFLLEYLINKGFITEFQSKRTRKYLLSYPI